MKQALIIKETPPKTAEDRVNNLFSCNPMGLSLIEGGAALILFAIYGALLGGGKKNNQGEPVLTEREWLLEQF